MKRKNNILSGLLLLLLLWLCYVHPASDAAAVPSCDGGEEAAEYLPDLVPGLPQTDRGNRTVLLHHMGYSVLYDEDLCLPLWVAWTLTPDRFAEVVSRYDKFLPDPLLDHPVTTDEYRNSGYDRGHICPAADNKWSEQAMRESFYMTNICPQNNNLNRGDWRELEDACREWTMQSGRLYVVGGPWLSGAERRTIGRRGIAVPDGFYKVVLSLTPLRGIGFVYENIAGDRPMSVYARSIDEVEQLTGIDFFSALPDSIEALVESRCDPAAWGISDGRKGKAK